MDNTITTRKAPTAEELQQLEADFLGYKRQVLEILGEESEIVKDITPRHMFFEQTKINIKAQRNNQWKHHEKLLNLLKQ